jgi:hypothetical protein
MKNTYLLFFLLFTAVGAIAQGGDTITRKTIIQFGYASEYLDGGNAAALSGFEAQLKWLFGKHKLAKGQQLDIAAYFNIGYSYFPSSDYSLGQGNIGIGLNTPSPVLGKFLRMDIGLGAVFYHGTISGKSWVGKKPDFGGYAGLSIPFGRRGGIYAKYWMPGAITALSSDDSYISPTFITVGVEF